MSKSVARLSPEIGETETLTGLPGQSLCHDLAFDLSAWTGWSAVSEALRVLGAEVQTLRLQPSPNGASGRCRFTGPSAEQARRLVAALIDDGSVLTARVEHLILKSSETAL